MTTTDPKLIEPVVSHLANRFLRYPLPKDFMPDNGVSVQRPNYAPGVPWTIYGTNLLDAEQAKAMVRFMLEGAPTAAAINEAVQNAGWIVEDGSGTRWRTWSNGWSDWTTDIHKATRYARREDAEAVHAEDEDAWGVISYSAAIEAHKESGHG